LLTEDRSTNQIRNTVDVTLRGLIAVAEFINIPVETIMGDRRVYQLRYYNNGSKDFTFGKDMGRN
jgi:hypothetical protein